MRSPKPRGPRKKGKKGIQKFGMIVTFLAALAAGAGHFPTM